LPVFVALADINANEELTAQNLKLEEWPKAIIPSGALTKLEDVEGKKVRVKIYAGEPILSSKMLGAADAIGAAKDIPPGFRVVHVKVDPTTGSSNLILPGDRVDVVVFRQPNADLHVTAAKIVLQDIKVFAVDTQTEAQFSQTKGEQTEPMSAKTIALLVTPQQAVILHAATEMAGAVRLVLRNPDDKAHVASQGATIGDIFGSEQRSDRESEEPADKEEKTGLTAWLNQQKEKAAPAAPAPPVAASRKMIVVLGAQLTQIDIPENGEPPLNQPTSGSSSIDNPATGPQFDGEPAPQGDESSDEPADSNSDESDSGDTSEESSGE
jgi:pilus assembly protein CpaB